MKTIQLLQTDIFQWLQLIVNDFSRQNVIFPDQHQIQRLFKARLTFQACMNHDHTLCLVSWFLSAMTVMISIPCWCKQHFLVMLNVHQFGSPRQTHIHAHMHILIADTTKTLGNFTGLRMDLGLILVISNMIIHCSFIGPTIWGPFQIQYKDIILPV